MSGAALVRADARRIPLADASVDLVVTSPPYLWKRKYAIDGGGELGNERDWRQFLDNLWAVTDEMLRVLKPSGSIWVNLGDTRVTGTEPKWLGIPVKSRLLIPERYRVGCQDRYAAQGVIVRQVQIWEKVNGLPESVDDRTRDSHEDFVHLVKQGKYYAAVDEIREPHAARYVERAERYGGRADTLEARTYAPGNRKDANSAKGILGLSDGDLNPLGKLPGSVWSLPSEPLVIPDATKRALNLPDHYAAFSSELPRRLILGFSPPGICTGCGEGRRPVVESSYFQTRGDSFARGQKGPVPGHHSWEDAPHLSKSATILGYACACTPSTRHPERRGKDFHAGTDRARQGMNDGNGGERFRRYQEELANPRGPVIEYHLDGWKAPPTRPAVVLDPFVGSGTTCLVARALGRYAVGIDLSADYLRLARWRIWDSGAADKAISRTWLERQGALL
jgi:DNA modification methylase